MELLSFVHFRSEEPGCLCWTWNCNNRQPGREQDFSKIPGFGVLSFLLWIRNFSDLKRHSFFPLAIYFYLFCFSENIIFLSGLHWLSFPHMFTVLRFVWPCKMVQRTTKFEFNFPLFSIARSLLCINMYMYVLCLLWISLLPY